MRGCRHLAFFRRIGQWVTGLELDDHGRRGRGAARRPRLGSSGNEVGVV